MTRMRKIIGAGLAAFASLVLFTGSASAHDLIGAGQPVCLEGNFMVANAQGGSPLPNGVFPGSVMEMNIMTGEIGIIVVPPFDGPWKPTGVLSGGVNGHAFISSAAQHKISEFHRDGEHVRTITPITAPPAGSRPGSMPRLLGSQFMPNGNIIQAVCDAEFPGAPNFFDRPASTPERAANSRLLVFDQESLSEVDEYSKPKDDRWTCMAGIIFSGEGMYVSMFHGAAVFVIDWKAGVDKNSGGIGSNNTKFALQLNNPSNRAQVIRVIDMYPGAAMDDPRRRDSLRAITLDADRNLYATNRARADDGSRRHHVAVVPFDDEGPAGTIAMDHDVQVIAGIRTNRISGPGCDFVSDEANGFPADLAACDFETIYVAATGTGNVMEYLIGEEYWDDSDFWGGGNCRDDSTGCAMYIATFFDGMDPPLDPRMLMTIHEAHVQ